MSKCTNSLCIAHNLDYRSGCKITHNDDLKCCPLYKPFKGNSANGASVPCGSGVSQPLAEVGLACGRQFLKVAGVIVSVENDICRDPMIPDEYRHQRAEHHLKWMPEMLEYAAKTINEAVG